MFLVSAPAMAGGANLSLNDAGVTGLEQMLDIARRNATSMRDADMAVSLYNALQTAKQAGAKADAEALATAQKTAQDASDELAKLRANAAKENSK
jgi:hypothetical protein